MEALQPRHGKQSVGDVASVYAFTKGTGNLEGMALAVADVVEDARINIVDVTKLLRPDQELGQTQMKIT